MENLLVPNAPGNLFPPTTLERHLGKPHDGHCTVSSIRKKRLYSEADNNDNDNSSNNNIFNADDSNKSNDNIQYINLSQHQMQASRLNIDERSSSSSSITDSFVCDKKTSILLASSTLSLPDSEQEKRILLANAGDWEAVMLSSLNGKTYHFLTSLENIQDVLVDQPVGQWTLPIKAKSATGECIARNRNHCSTISSQPTPSTNAYRVMNIQKFQSQCVKVLTETG